MYYKRNHYLVEMYDKQLKRWIPCNGNRNKEWAIRLAQKPYYTNNGRTRVRYIKTEVIVSFPQTKFLLNRNRR